MVLLVPCLAPRPPLCPRWGSTFHSPARQHFADLALHDLHKHEASQTGQPGQVKKVGLSLLYLYRILLSLFVSPAVPFSRPVSARLRLFTNFFLLSDRYALLTRSLIDRHNPIDTSPTFRSN